MTPGGASDSRGDGMEREAFNSGDTIFRDRAFLIVVGSVSAQLPNGRFKSLGPGEIFGEMGVIDSRPRSATMIAERYTVCAIYSESELLDAIRNDPESAISLIRDLIARLREAN